MRPEATSVSGLKLLLLTRTLERLLDARLRLDGDGLGMTSCVHSGCARPDLRYVKRLQFRLVSVAARCGTDMYYIIYMHILYLRPYTCMYVCILYITMYRLLFDLSSSLASTFIFLQVRSSLPAAGMLY
jgi:hypothetical protein